MSDIITPEPYQPPTVTSLSMRRPSYPEGAGLTGSITFRGKLGEVQLTLSDESCATILALMADAAAKSVAEVADALRSQFTSLPVPTPPEKREVS